MTSISADEIAQAIKQLDDDEKRLLANFVETLKESEDDEVEAFKKSLDPRSGSATGSAESEREKAFEDMTLEEQKRAFFEGA